MCDLCLVFFFFKQQRACEMLISDWRSGVCSSELLGRLTAANQTSGANDLTFTYDALGRNLTQAGPLGTMTSTYDAAGRRTELQWPDAFYVNYDHLVTGEVTKVRENGATSRSEEHTSELQSLMRISYAVFCLKKKTIE